MVILLEPIVFIIRTIQSLMPSSAQATTTMTTTTMTSSRRRGRSLLERKVSTNGANGGASGDYQVEVVKTVTSTSIVTSVPCILEESGLTSRKQQQQQQIDESSSSSMSAVASGVEIHVQG